MNDRVSGSGFGRSLSLFVPQTNRRRQTLRWTLLFAALFAAAACEDGKVLSGKVGADGQGSSDVAADSLAEVTGTDATTADATGTDVSGTDASGTDAIGSDAAGTDATSTDATDPDAGATDDVGPSTDAGLDAETDAGSETDAAATSDVQTGTDTGSETDAAATTDAQTGTDSGSETDAATTGSDTSATDMDSADATDEPASACVQVVITDSAGQPLQGGTVGWVVLGTDPTSTELGEASSACLVVALSAEVTVGVAVPGYVASATPVEAAALGTAGTCGDPTTCAVVTIALLPEGPTCSVAGDCDASNPCNTTTCESGKCVWTAQTGTKCSDGNACTQSDNCQSGTCVGSNPVVCAALDQCYDVGTCDPATGACSNPNKPDNAVCDDDNACTTTDTCQGGGCFGSVPVECTAQDQCHTVGSCDPLSGDCSNPSKEDGAVCQDGNACSLSDSCQGGSCKSGDPVVCVAASQCHEVGSCDPDTGMCDSPAKNDNTECDDGDACTKADTCQNATCEGGDPVVCSAQDDCHEAGSCDPQSGNCSNPAKPDNEACDDGNACTTIDSCDSGSCTGSDPVECVTLDDCHYAGACDPMVGDCSNPSQPDNYGCNDGDACTQSDTCQGGNCTGSNPVVCLALDSCHTVGTCNSETGTCTDPVAEPVAETKWLVDEPCDKPEVGFATTIVTVVPAASGILSHVYFGIGDWSEPTTYTVTFKTAGKTQTFANLAFAPRYLRPYSECATSNNMAEAVLPSGVLVAAGVPLEITIEGSSGQRHYDEATNTLRMSLASMATWPTCVEDNACEIARFCDNAGTCQPGVTVSSCPDAGPCIDGPVTCDPTDGSCDFAPVSGVSESTILLSDACDKPNGTFQNTTVTVTPTSSGVLSHVWFGIGSWTETSVYSVKFVTAGKTYTFDNLTFSAAGDQGYDPCVPKNNMAGAALPTPVILGQGIPVTITITGSGGDRHYDSATDTLRMTLESTQTWPACDDDDSCTVDRFCDGEGSCRAGFDVCID